MTFSKIIHQIWFQGCDKVTRSEFRENMRNWQLLNPEWKYNCMDDAGLRKACYEYSQDAGKIYDKFPLLHQKVDFGRYVVLFQQGGAYIDMDCYALRSFESNSFVRELLKKSENGHQIGLSVIRTNYVESMVWFKVPFAINNGIILCTRNNPFMKMFIDDITEKAKNNESVPDVDETTGPKQLNKFFHPLLVEFPQQFTLFPYTVFEPCTVAGECFIKNDTVGIHRFDLSWLSKNRKFLATSYGKCRDFVTGALLMLVIWYIISKLL
jgi:mannosyltransferase OCH1-like enzyme